MKKLLFIGMCLSMAFVSCTKDSDTKVKVTDITMQNNIELSVDAKMQLKAIITPAELADATITWESSYSNIATVDENGLVTGISKGTAVIIASSSNGINATCKVKVNALPFSAPEAMVGAWKGIRFELKKDGKIYTEADVRTKFLSDKTVEEQDKTIKGLREQYSYVLNSDNTMTVSFLIQDNATEEITTETLNGVLSDKANFTNTYFGSFEIDNSNVNGLEAIQKQEIHTNEDGEVFIQLGFNDTYDIITYYTVTK